MGQPVTVIEKPSKTSGIVRYEINRAISGMGHEYYTASPDALAHRPTDVVAQKIFALSPGISSVHINANVITVSAKDDATLRIVKSDIRDAIASMFTFYVDGVVPAPSA